MNDSLLDTIEAVVHETETALSGETESSYFNSSFSRVNPRLQIAHDSTSIKAGKKCWRYYKYSILDGYRLSGNNPHLIFGTLFHSATELYTRLRIGGWDWKIYRQLRKAGADEISLRLDRPGCDHNRAIILVFRWIIYYSWDRERNAPWTSDEPTKTLNTLLRTVIQYLDTFANENLRTLQLANGKPAVELSFSFTLNDLDESGSFVASTGEEFLLCGHIDRGVYFNDEIWILDKKTTKYALDDRYFAQYSPDIQVTVYTIAGHVVFHQEIAGLIIDGCQILVNGSRFRRRPIPRAPEHLEEFLRGLKRYLADLETCVRLDDWPMNEESCGHGYLQCTYRPVCSADPAMRQEILDNFYQKRHWDPLVPR